jgi:hypothetical protein
VDFSATPSARITPRAPAAEASPAEILPQKKYCQADSPTREKQKIKNEKRKKQRNERLVQR